RRWRSLGKAAGGWRCRTPCPRWSGRGGRVRAAGGGPFGIGCDAISIHLDIPVVHGVAHVGDVDDHAFANVPLNSQAPVVSRGVLKARSLKDALGRQEALGAEELRERAVVVGRRLEGWRRHERADAYADRAFVADAQGAVVKD